MSFLLDCPNCGERSVYEFRFGGEFRERPAGPVSQHDWAEYLHMRKNEAGEHKEWWYHLMGCRSWFFAIRDTRTNVVKETRIASV